MRALRSRRSYLFCAAILAPLACVNSSDNPPGPPQFDGGGPFEAGPGVDGSLPDVAQPDTSVPDAIADAPADAALPAASVTVLLAGLPRAGIPVVFQDATGAVLETKTTGADGKATRDVAAGSMVTVALGGPGMRELFTFVGVKDGDAIVAVDVARPPSVSPVLDVELLAAANAVSYSAQVGNCNGFGQPPVVPVTVSPGCSFGGLAPALALAQDANGANIAWTAKKGNTLATDGGASTTGVLPAWNPTFASYNVSVTNAPAGANLVSLVNQEIANGVPYLQINDLALTEGAAAGPVRTLPGYADSFQPQASVDFPGNPIYATSFIAKNLAPAADGATQAFDLAQLLPAIATASIDGSTAGKPKVTWTSAASMAAADGGFARVSWSAQVDGGGFESNGWTFVVPSSATTVQGPDMPAALAAWLPPSGTQFDQPVVAFVETDAIASYDELLGRYPAFLLADYTGGPVFGAPPLPTGVTLRGAFIRASPL